MSKPAISVPPIPKNVLPMFEALAEYADRLPEVEELQKTLVPSGSFETVTEFLTKLSIPRDQATDVIRAIVNIVHLSEEAEGAVGAVVDAITARLDSDAPEEWRVKNLDKWKNGTKKIGILADPDGPFGILHKTTELTRMHQAVFEEGRLLTDIRPVFDSKASRILRAVVTHMLVVKYYDGTEHRTLHFAMDSDDIRKLQALCERALQKVATIKTNVAGLPWDTEIAGGDDDEAS